jgi:hypothetical protein
MPAKVIPVTGLNLGPVGTVSQSDFPLRTPRQVKATDTKNIAFGELAVLNSDNSYSSLAQFIANVIANGGATVIGTGSNRTPIGIAAANTRTNPTFPMAGNQGTVTPAGAYVPGTIADVLTQGTINVQVNNGTPSADGVVYARVAANASIPAGVVGGIEAQADASVNTTMGTTSGSNSITVASGTGVVAGQIITGAGIPANTCVTNVAGTTVTMSQNATATAASGVAVNFASTVALDDFRFKTGVLGGDGTAQLTIKKRIMP